MTRYTHVRKHRTRTGIRRGHWRRARIITRGTARYIDPLYVGSVSGKTQTMMAPPEIQASLTRIGPDDESADISRHASHPDWMTIRRYPLIRRSRIGRRRMVARRLTKPRAPTFLMSEVPRPSEITFADYDVPRPTPYAQRLLNEVPAPTVRRWGGVTLRTYPTSPTRSPWTWSRGGLTITRRRLRRRNSR